MSRLPALGPRGEGWVLIQFVLLWLVVATGWGLGGAWTGEARVATAVAGLLLGLVGLALAGWGLLSLGTALTPLPHPRDDAELVDTGAFHVARHPIYGGLVLGALGYALLMASPAAIAASIVLLLFFRLKSAREEAWLRQRYPGYDAYAARTRRMIPFVY